MSQTLFQKLLHELNQIDRPGSFCGQGEGPTALPGLTVEGVGAIGLPLSDEQARKLKKVCEQAPYGKGEKTLVDTSVRQVWHLPPEKFQLTNSLWTAQLDKRLPAIGAQLGLEKVKLAAHLYDLLLYEPGSFFLPHRDSEKEAGMVATLVVTLPSQFEGGELIVRHEGQEVTIDLGGPPSAFQTQYAVFYADCEHEVKPLKSGHRLALVYNVTLAKGKTPLGAPSSRQSIEPITQILRDWSELPDSHRLVVLLEHAYTEANLSWDNLKGVDREQADVLAAAATQAGCRAFLALLTYYEVGNAEGGDYYRGRHSRGSDDADNYTMGSLIESSLLAEHWFNPAGKKENFGSLRIKREDLIDPEGLEAIDPEVEFEGYTGNAGMTLQHWYRHAAIFVWPTRSHFAVLCDAGARTALPTFFDVTDTLKKDPDNAELRAQVRAFAARLMQVWPRSYQSTFADESSQRRTLLHGLAVLDDSTLIQRFFTELLVSDPALRPGEALLQLAEKHGWATYAPALQALVAATEARTTLARNLEMIESICQAKPGKADGWSELCTNLASTFLDRLEAIDASGPRDWASREVKREKVMTHLFQALLAAKLDALLGRFLKHTDAQMAHYPPALRVQAILDLAKWLEKQQPPLSPAFRSWVAGVRKHLETRTIRPPQPPNDQRREDSMVNCNCKFCVQVKALLRSPSETVLRLPAKESDRGHVQSEAGGADLKFSVLKTGSPYSLVCTKTDASYQQALKTYHAEVAQLGKFPQLDTPAKAKPATKRTKRK